MAAASGLPFFSPFFPFPSSPFPLRERSIGEKELDTVLFFFPFFFSFPQVVRPIGRAFEKKVGVERTCASLLSFFFFFLSLFLSFSPFKNPGFTVIEVIKRDWDWSTIPLFSFFFPSLLTPF